MASAQGSALAAPRRSACRQCSTRAVRAAPAAAARRAPALRRQAVHASVARLCDASSEPAPAPLPAPSLRRRVALFAAAAALPAALLRPALADGGAALESATFAAGDFIFLCVPRVKALTSSLRPVLSTGIRSACAPVCVC
jgi:hypothetical protein